MRKLILIAGLAAAVAAPTFAPTLASAQTACERSRSTNRAVGTVAGGVLGALAGSAIASRHDSTAGIIIGGAGGAVIGNQLAKGQPCPPGYVRSYYAPKRAATHTVRSATTTPSSARCSWQEQSYRDANGGLLRRQVQVCR